MMIDSLSSQLFASIVGKSHAWNVTVTQKFAKSVKKDTCCPQMESVSTVMTRHM